MTRPHINPSMASSSILRRQWLQTTGGGIGLAALASLLQAQPTSSSDSPKGLPGVPHHPPRAKRVIVMWQEAVHRTWICSDPKPTMENMKDIPDSIRGTTHVYRPCPVDTANGPAYQPSNHSKSMANVEWS
ncbi:MAG: hypothetical protein U0905_18315 [Pirellulales bacterium]